MSTWSDTDAASAVRAAIVARLEKELLDILNAPDMQTRLSDPALGLSLSVRGSERFLEFIQSQLRVWAPVIKAGNIQVD